jgi:tight adherence protein C
LEDASTWIFMSAVGLAAAALLWAAFASVTAMLNPVRRRLKALQQNVEQSSATRPTASGRLSALWRLLEPQKETERAGMQLKLVQAGLRAPGALGLMYMLKIVLAVGVPIAALTAVSIWAKSPVPMVMKVVIGLAACLLGSLLPDIFVSRRFEARKNRLMDGLPDALDLLVTCTEAGLGLNAALERVAEQMPGSHPELAWELAQVNAEIRAGIERNVALKNLGERTGLEEIHGLVSLISHSTRLGTGVAGTLRIYAEDFRDRRMQRAEEVAATVGTKLIFPLLLCLFPSFFVVAVGPAVLGVMRALGKN